MGAGRVEGRYIAAQQKGFSVFYQDVAIHQLHFFHAKAFNFPAQQGDAGFDFFLDKIIVRYLFVSHDCGIGELGFS